MSKPVGGCWELIFYRLGGGVVLGTPCYTLLALLGEDPSRKHSMLLWLNLISNAVLPNCRQAVYGTRRLVRTFRLPSFVGWLTFKICRRRRPLRSDRMRLRGSQFIPPSWRVQLGKPMGSPEMLVVRHAYLPSKISRLSN